MRATLLLAASALILAACAHAATHYTPTPFGEACAGRRVLEVRSQLDRPLRVGWIPDDQIGSTRPLVLTPVWLGTARTGTTYFPIPSVGQVLFTIPDDAPDHAITHSIMCETRT